jgi:hypothetical protein
LVRGGMNLSRNALSVSNQKVALHNRGAHG